jgi:glycosyltransferase involved in cell wall biosynthesis
MSKPQISVILPVYNAGAFVEQAMRSVLAQSLYDLELIVINDGSKDDSLAVIERIAAIDKRVSVISRENKGLVYSLNEGIQYARGDWVARMDADDVCLPQRLQAQLAYAQKHDLDICGGWIKTFGQSVGKVRAYYTGHDALKLHLLFNACFAHPSVIIKRSVLLKESYNINAIHAEDYELWTRLAQQGVRLGNLPQVVLNYRVHSQQVTITHCHAQDDARERIALYYGRVVFADFDSLAHQRIMSRFAPLLAKQVMDSMHALNTLMGQYGNPENVVVDNAFLFLARHAEIGVVAMYRACQMMPFSYIKKIVLLGLAFCGAHQNSALFKLLYRYR